MLTRRKGREKVLHPNRTRAKDTRTLRQKSVGVFRRKPSSRYNTASRKPAGSKLQREYEVFASLTSKRIADKVYRPDPKQHWHARLWRVRGDSTWHAQSFEFPEATAIGKTKQEVREKLLDEICRCALATQERARKVAARKCSVKTRVASVTPRR